MAGDKKEGAILLYRVVYPAPGVYEAGIASVGASDNRNAIFYCSEDRTRSMLVWHSAISIPGIIGDNDEKLRAILDKFPG